MSRTEARRIILAGLLFFLSGGSALVYQVAWQRILALHSGVGLYSIAIIVAAFMAGLGIGSHWGGRVSEGIEPARSLRLFALLELGIGLFGVISPFLYYDWLYPHASRLPSPSFAGAGLHFAALIPPTTLMGMSLPFLVRAMVREVASAGRTIGYLYGTNILGAAAGSLVTPWLLIPHFGIAGAIGAAAVGNLVVAAGAMLLRGGAAEARQEDAGALAPRNQPTRHPFGLWLGLYALSGFVALSLEILWFRLVDVAAKSTAFTFGTVLALYLLGSGLGCLLAVVRLDRVERPLRAFLLSQCAILLLSSLAVVALARLPPDTPYYAWFVDYWAGNRFFRFGRSLDVGHVVRLYLALPLFLFALPTALMGFSFPLLQRAVHDDARTSGRKVGVLQAANILGCVAGSLLVGLLTLRFLGTAGSLRLLPLIGLAFAFVGWRYYGRSFLLAALALLAAAASLPDNRALWYRLHGVGPGEGALFEEDATGVVALTPERGDSWRLAINGKSNSWLPYGGVHTVLGALPALIHPAPRSIGVIGLGSGDTVWAAACRSATERVTVFEISSPQPRILRRLASQQPQLTGLGTLLRDPRVTIRLQDGRQALAAEPELYDLIEADAIWPEGAYSGNLYSLEFFSACARRLRPGGLMCTWSPTKRVRATFLAAFPHVLEAGGGIVLLGSRQPLRPDIPTWRSRLDAAAAYLGPGRTRMLAQWLDECRPATARDHIAPNRDLFPRDEFARPALAAAAEANATRPAVH